VEASHLFGYPSNREVSSLLESIKFKAFFWVKL
jgi:hypothetical protein